MTTWKKIQQIQHTMYCNLSLFLLTADIIIKYEDQCICTNTHHAAVAHLIEDDGTSTHTSNKQTQA